MRYVIVLFVLVTYSRKEPAKIKEEAAPPIAETIQPQAESVAPVVAAAMESTVHPALSASEQCRGSLGGQLAGV